MVFHNNHSLAYKDCTVWFEFCDSIWKEKICFILKFSHFWIFWETSFQNFQIILKLLTFSRKKENHVSFQFSNSFYGITQHEKFQSLSFLRFGIFQTKCRFSFKTCFRMKREKMSIIVTAKVSKNCFNYSRGNW